MDSIYYSAPRPYNKFPHGYRPINDGGDTSRRLRTSNSWSSFSPMAHTVVDQQQQYSSATLPHHRPFPVVASPLAPPLSAGSQSTCASPDAHHHNTYFHEPTTTLTRAPQRTESSSTLFDNYNSSRFSPRELSPLSTTSEYCNNMSTPINNSVQSPVSVPIARCYDNVPRPPQQHPPNQFQQPVVSRRENDFLQNLQRQKETAFDMSQSWYGHEMPPRMSPNRQNDWQQQEQSQYPRRLTKTQSDMSFDNVPSNNYSNSTYSYLNSNNNSINSKNGHQLESALRNRVISPNWMTDPPPPKSFREDFIIRTNPNTIPSLSSSSFDRFRLEPNFREHQQYQEPVQLQNPNFRNYHRDTQDERNSSYHPQRNVVVQQEMPNRVDTISPNLSYQINQSNQSATSQNHHNYQNIPMAPPATVTYREREREALNQSHSNRNSALYSNEPIPLSHNRVLHIHPVANQETYQQFNNPSYDPPNSQHPVPPPQTQRARIQSPIREFARLTSPISEMIDVQQPMVTQNIDRDRIFSPVESKVYNRTGPTVINGFTSNRHTYNSHTDNYDTRNRRDSSQPPVAVIEPNINVTMPSDPMPYEKPHYGRDQHPAYANFLHNGYQQNSEPTLKQSFSPISNYENDSDLDIEELARKALPKYLREERRYDSSSGDRHYNRDNLHGILIKNPSLHRSSSKKVVFIDQDKGQSTGSAEAPAHVRAFDDAVEGAISKWSDLTDQIGGDISTLKPKVLSVFDQLRNFLWTAAGKAEPSGEEVQKTLAPIIQLINDITEFKDSKRNTSQFNHLSTIAEGLPAVGWVTVKKTPAPYIKEFIEASTFFINRILKEFKSTDVRNVEWVKAWKEIFEEMQKFVRQTHTTGLVWNSAPGSAPASVSNVSAPKPAAAAGGPPPPPPPPPLPADLFANVSAAPTSADQDKINRDALFAALNKGEAVTAGLKKVTSDMQTHKNPTLRGNVAVPATIKSSKSTAPTAQAAPPARKPAKKELQDGKQWNVEYFVNDKNIVIDVTDKKQTIYIFRCENSTIKVNGKANSITLDGCKKTAIVFDALVAQCETINCQSVQIQTLGELPTLSIQKTDGCQVYLSKVAQEAEIVTSKSSEMNILIQTTDDGDYVEYPVPEQFKTKFVNGKLVTTVSDIV